jgi:hypothetical protein
VHFRKRDYRRYMLVAWDHRGKGEAEIRDFALYEVE